MKTDNKRQLEKFYKNIKSLLLCPNAEKEDLFFGLRADMEEYSDDHPDATMEEIQSHFGKPEDIANSYQFSIGEEEVRKKVKKKKTLWYLLGAVILVLFIVALVLIIVYLQKATSELPEYYVVTEKIIEGETPSEILNDPNAVTA